MRLQPGQARGRWWIIPLTLALALSLMVVDYPEWMRYARPDWVTLVLFYWCLAVPGRVGVGTGWLVGLLLDALEFTLLGQHAVGKAFIAMVSNHFHRRLRMYALLQQCMVICVISSIDIAIVAWVYHLAGEEPVRWQYWQSALTTTLLWPIVFILLRRLRRRGGIT